VPWKKLADFVPSTGDASFDPKTFVDDPGGAVISIVHVYHSVRGAPAGSVLELAIFSHAWLEGPVLQNTDDNVHGTADGTFPDGSQRRDPNDQDGRSRTDFEPNMGEDPTKESATPVKSGGKNALTQFKSAFDAKGVIRVYGCNVQDLVEVPPGGAPNRHILRSTAFQLIHQVFTLPVTAVRRGGAAELVSRGKGLLKKTPPTGTFPIDMGYEVDLEISLPDPPTTNHNTLLDWHFRVDPAFFGTTPTNVINQTWKEVIKSIARQTVGTYLFKGAEATGVTCFGGIPGTGGDFEGKDVPNAQMNIPRATYGAVLRFLESFMDVSITEAGAAVQRNYGIFDTATVAKVKDHVLNG
jgi:hypothetical protein